MSKTVIKLSQGGTIEGEGFREIPLTDWLAMGERLFGPDKKQWKWKCSNCGHVQSIADLIELRNQKIVPPDFDAGTVAYFSCIGRFDTRIPEKDVGTIWNKKSPCNYTLGGLFLFAKTFVINESGERVPVFEFATA